MKIEKKRAGDQHKENGFGTGSTRSVAYKSRFCIKTPQEGGGERERIFLKKYLLFSLISLRWHNKIYTIIFNLSYPLAPK